MRIPHSQAETIANQITHKIEQMCDDVVVCGSIRRRESKVKDIDMVVLPTVERYVLTRDLWNNPVEYKEKNLLLNMLNDRVVMDGLELELVKGGSKKVMIRQYGTEIYCELWLVERRNQLGFATLVRTGPAKVTKRIMQLALDQHQHITGYELHMHEKGGRPGKRTVCPRGGECRTVAQTEIEMKAFFALGIDYPEPEARYLEHIEKLIVKAYKRKFNGGVVV